MLRSYIEDLLYIKIIILRNGLGYLTGFPSWEIPWKGCLWNRHRVRLYRYLRKFVRAEKRDWNTEARGEHLNYRWQSLHHVVDTMGWARQDLWPALQGPAIAMAWAMQGGWGLLMQYSTLTLIFSVCCFWAWLYLFEWLAFVENILFLFCQMPVWALVTSEDFVYHFLGQSTTCHYNEM